MSDSNASSFLLTVGSYTHECEIIGKKLVFDMFPVGSIEKIQRQISGLDQRARGFSEDILNLAYSLRYCAGYDFQNSLEKKLDFLRSLQEPVYHLLVEEYRIGKMRQIEAFQKLREETKKSIPDLS